MNILLLRDPAGGEVYLTTESALSHYGIPVLRITSDEIGRDFGPSDMIGNLDEPEKPVTAAGLVAGWARSGERTVEELDAARLFLKQWPKRHRYDERTV
jgi:hypothetical protein